jgi:hypothetical protein
LPAGASRLLQATGLNMIAQDACGLSARASRLLLATGLNMIPQDGCPISLAFVATAILIGILPSSKRETPAGKPQASFRSLLDGVLGNLEHLLPA